MSKPKVGLIGNMNNNHFVLLRYLLDLGVDAYLLILKNEPKHFSPSADTNNIKSYIDRIKYLKWGDRKYWFSAKSIEIRRDLLPYDFLIGTDLSPAFCGRASRALDVFAPHGSDLGHFTFFRLTWPNKFIQTWAAVFMQRKYIPQVKYFHMENNSGLYERRWNIFKGKSIRWPISFPLIYKDDNEPRIPPNDFIDSIKKIRNDTEIIFYYNVRHVWGGNAKNDANQKGTDNLIKALFLFKMRNPYTSFTLVTFEYGTAYLKTKKLISELGLDNFVKWFPLMERKDIVLGMEYSDLVFGEFSNTWATYSVIAEALSLNKPIITYRNDALYESLYGEMYYILNAKSDLEICEKIEFYLANKEDVLEKASHGWAWYTNKIVNPALSLYLEAINS